MPNPPKKIISNANDSDSFNELKHRQNYCHIRTGAFTYAMVHLVSRATDKISGRHIFFFYSAVVSTLRYSLNSTFCVSFRLWSTINISFLVKYTSKRQSASERASSRRLQLQSLSCPTTSLNTSPFVQSTTSQWPPLSGPMRRRRPAAFRFERCRCIADLLIPTIATMSPCVACGRSFKSPSRRSAFF